MGGLWASESWPQHILTDISVHDISFISTFQYGLLTSSRIYFVISHRCNKDLIVHGWILDPMIRNCLRAQASVCKSHHVSGTTFFIGRICKNAASESNRFLCRRGTAHIECSSHGACRAQSDRAIKTVTKYKHVGTMSFAQRQDCKMNSVMRVTECTQRNFMAAFNTARQRDVNARKVPI